MANRLEKTLPAEYKGFQFLVISEQIKGGRKAPVFDIPNSNERIIQDLGGLPQEFSIFAIISGDNFRQDAKKFVSILLEKEPGLLILPVFGSSNVKCTDYTETSQNNSVGKISFSITFKLFRMAVDDEDVPTVNDVYNDYLEASNALADALLENWEPPKTNANRLSAINDSKSFLASVKDGFKAVASAVRTAERAIGAVNTAINTAEMYAELFVKEGALAVVASAVGLGSAYQSASDMIDWGNTLPNRLSNLGDAIASGFNNLNADNAKNFDILLWESNKTFNWDARNKNRVLTVESARFQALALLLYQSSGLVFGKIDELSNVKLNMQDWFVAITTSKHAIIANNQNFIDAILKLKESAFKILNSKEKFLHRVVEIDVENESPIALAYRLYADEVTSRAELMEKSRVLVQINNGMQIFDGKIKVLEK